MHVLGSIDDVRTVLYAADVLLNTSRTEGMPGSLIEAAMCSMPSSPPTSAPSARWALQCSRRLRAPPPENCIRC